MRLSLNRKTIAWMLGLTAGISVLMEAVVFRSAFSALRASGKTTCACSGTLLHTPWLLYGVAGLFLLGLLAGVGLLLRSSIVTWRMRRHLDRETEVLGQRVLLSNRRCEVFTFGFFRPQIALCAHCAKELRAEELQAVLTHETNHVRQKDPLKLMIVQTLRVAFFFIPLMHTLGTSYKKVIELDADRGVTNTEALGSALLRLMETKRFAAPVTYFASTLEERIERILNPAWRLRLQISTIGFLLSLVVMVAGVGVSAYPRHQTVPRICAAVPVCQQAPVDRNQNHYYTL